MFPARAGAESAVSARQHFGGESMLKEFKDFAFKGNVLDLAVGVIIAGAFGLIVSSLVDDIIMPIVGAIFGGLDFSNLFAPLADGVSAATLEEAKKQGAVLAYGSFITAVVNFLIIAFVLFLIVRAANNMKKKEEAAPAAPPADVQLLTEIRDLLKK
jgi:large conductance mechanosensitive channel